jgi:DNA-binding MarR family transcriptional regulator
LEVLAEIYDHESNCYFFRHIAAETGLEITQVRKACRSLARKGLAEYLRGLFDEDGMVAGSGYCCTKAGAELIEHLNPPTLI